MLTNLARKTLEIYLLEKRIITQSEFGEDSMLYISRKDAVFITLFYKWKVIASSGRIQCKKENTLFECIDNTLLCLKDERFSMTLQNLEWLQNIQIQVDIFGPERRRILTNYEALDITKEWIILLSQNAWALSIILPNMVLVWADPKKYFSLACKKAGLPLDIPQNEYVLYGFTTEREVDFW